MSFTTLPAVTSGDFIRASWAALVKGDLDDHETRIVAAPSATQTLTNKTIASYYAAPTLRHVEGLLALTDAQTKALPTTPITLAAAPGSGKTIVLKHAVLFENATAGAYTNINATYSAIALYWLGDFTVWASTPILKDTSTTPSTTRLTDFLGAAKHIANLIPYHDGPATTPNGWVIPLIPVSTVYENKALAIAADNNGSGNYTGGNAANSLTVYFEYWEIG